MQDILDNNFEDHPAVSQELVKFISLNTSVEAVDSLTKKMFLMESKTHQMEGDLKRLQKNSSMVGKKCDTLAGQMKDIIKRVTKLEK